VVALAAAVGGDAAAVVLHPHQHLAPGGAIEADQGVVGAGVADHVGQGFADDLQQVKFLIHRQGRIPQPVVQPDLGAGPGRQFLHHLAQSLLQPARRHAGAKGREQLAQVAVGAVEAGLDLAGDLQHPPPGAQAAQLRPISSCRRAICSFM
jgi:hypothetical protein